ncbi:hypothetical protein BS50DRAFT_682306 [Corynespora cassiicola Philippines]|uniref:Zn(2)-C6 fungal-type domain-containing protein n=1 Tax=Corynespora cassiicola Philippines TaxID=1448308 RepID=A0A2T2N205_CORCC|nr:hypothetical protein BS50DRAFT_682306 [Corynespora cassiicola Philippines]
MWEDTPPSISTTRESSRERSQPSDRHLSLPPTEEWRDSDLAPESRSKSKAITRRSHRKSRSGCQNCKQRRIKCDERKPECANCTKRRVRCDYAASLGASSSPSTCFNQNPHDFCVSEIELTHHWSTSTCYSMSMWPTGAIEGRDKIVSLGLHHDHLLHLIFAFTALHLASCRPTRFEEYVAKADRHYSLALPSLTTELASMSPDNCNAVFTSVQLVCFLGFARGPQPGEYLAFGHGRSEWLIMFRGIKTTLQTIPRSHFTEHKLPHEKARHRPLPRETEPPDYVAQLEDLHSYVEFIAETEGQRDGNTNSVDILKEMFHNRYTPKDSEYHVAFGWLYRMDEGFLQRLQNYEPGPLIIYGHFTVLMYDMEKFWYMKGWTHHIMSGIYAALPNDYRPWLDWPMRQVSWIPP